MKILKPEDIILKNSEKSSENRLLGFFFTFFVIVIILGTAVGIALYSFPVPTPDIKIIAGDNSDFYSKDQKTWLPATPGAIIPYGSTLRTGSLGRVDFSFLNATMRMEANSEIDTAQGTYMRPFPRILLLHGNLFVKSEGDKIRISVPVSQSLSLRRGLTADFISIFSSTLEKGSLLFKASPDLSSEEIFAFKGSLEVRSYTLKKHFILNESNKAVFSSGNGEAEILQLKDSEKIQLEDAFGKIKTSEAQTVTAPKSQVETIPKTLPEKNSMPQKTMPVASDSALILIKSAKGFGTKSSIFEVSFKTDAQGLPYSEFHYEVPTPDSIAGIHWPFSSGTANLSKFTKLHLQIHAVEGSLYPENLRIEIADGERTLRALSSKISAQDWQTLEFPVKFSPGAKGTEISLVLTHSKVGQAQKGALQIKDFYLS